jgi:hypothetical protein
MEGGTDEMQRPRRGFVLALLLASSLGVGYTAKPQSKSPSNLSATSLKLTNFVAHVREQEFSKSGLTFGASEVTVAHRADGSWAYHRSVYSPDGKGETGVLIELLDVPARKYVMMADPFIKSVMTFYLTDEHLHRLWAAENGCEATGVKEQLWRQAISPGQRRQILGLDAVRVERTDERSGLRRVTWVAPQFDCLALEQTEDYPDGAHNNRSFVSLHVGVPPQSLFEIPADYIERSPIAFEAAFEARFPGHRIWYNPSIIRAKQVEYLHGRERHLQER